MANLKMNKIDILKLPDRLSALLISRSLTAAGLKREVHYFSHIESTNTYAKTLANNGDESGTLVVANYQSAGRGRGHRKWMSAPNKGLLFSEIVPPPGNLVYPQLLTIAASIAVCKTFKFLYGLKAQIKWPNDVLLKEKKICGVLTEVASRRGHTNALVVGIGINVNQNKNELSHTAKTSPISLRIELGKSVSRLAILVSYMKYFDTLYMYLSKGKNAEIVAEWKKYSSTLGKQVRLKTSTREILGTALDMEADGSLVVREDSGFIHKCISGDISEIHWTEEKTENSE